MFRVFDAGTLLIQYLRIEFKYIAWCFLMGFVVFNCLLFTGCFSSLLHHPFHFQFETPQLRHQHELLYRHGARFLKMKFGPNSTEESLGFSPSEEPLFTQPQPLAPTAPSAATIQANLAQLQANVARIDEKRIWY